MSRIITINSFKSTCPGGVESLIRSFHNIGSDRGWDFLELHKWGSSKEIHNVSQHTKFIEYGSGQGKVGKILTRINLYKELLKLNPQNSIIFIFHMSDLLSVPISVLKNNKIIVVQTNRFDIFLTSLGKVAVFLYSSFIDFFTVYTEKDKVKLKNIYPKLDNKIEVIPRGCRVEKAIESPAFSNKLVTITRLDEKQKNISEMIEIVNSLPETYTLDIYGEGEEEEISLIKSLVNSVPRVKFCGAATKIEDVLKKHSIFLMTSNYEGFGQTLIEARSQGLPIVLYNTFDAASYIVKNGGNGFLIPKGDKKLFMEKVLEITYSKEAYCVFSENSLGLASETDEALVNNKWGLLLDASL